MDLTYDTSENLSLDTLALIFRSGQPDEFGRTWPLAISGRTRNGRSIFARRNVSPHVAPVQRALAACEASGMTHLQVIPDSCG